MQPDYPRATLVFAHPTNFRTAQRRLSDLRNFVVHITDGRGRADAVADMWREPGHGTSAHFVIGQKGPVLQCVLLKDVAQHAHDANGTSVGVEHCARSPGSFGKGDPGLPVSDTQYALSSQLAAWFCSVTGNAPDRTTIQGHVEIDDKTTHDDCPNSIWDWDRYMSMVAAEYAALKAPLVG